MGKEDKEYTWNLVAKKLSGEATPEELLELERLLRNNPDLHYPVQAIADLWKPANPKDQKEAELAFNRHLDRMNDLGSISPGNINTEDPGLNYNPPQRQRSVNIRALVAAALCLLILTGGWYYSRSRNVSSVTKTGSPARDPGSTVFTRNGSRTNLLLPDGTQVWLNAGSRITYNKDYGTATRDVNLIGEAFFDVARNAEKPFIIHTSRIDIKVLGTRFNVKSYPTDRTTETTLIRGSIEVSVKDRPSEKIILKPNEKLVVANDDSTLHRITDGPNTSPTNESLVSIRKPTYESHTGAIIETSWVEDKLSFQDEDFSELARQLERWYGVSIRFDQSRLEDLHFTGSFRIETIQQALDALKMTNPFSYVIHDKAITIFAK